MTTYFIIEILGVLLGTAALLWFSITVNKESLKFKIKRKNTGMKDALGKTLFEGDDIVFTYYGDGHMHRGKVTKVGTGRLYIKPINRHETYIVAASVQNRIIKV